ncbi:MAG: methylmalonyl Co-A mutase-associated GTPase MeaB [Actinobacteria bacterium]|nr:methylmalonyl Co-A mutase-associated GTPase MeaB [Actinomycetota bacterium]
MRSRPVPELVAAAVDGDRLALARVLSLVERGGPQSREVSRLAFPEGGEAHTVGITGAPGAGKSTLTDQIIRLIRKDRDSQVAVLAVDPSSPRTGGAFLGDRVRMQDHATDPGVFIRSMASRGHLGGLALATPEAIRVLDASGFPVVIVETVGVGQVEIEVAGAADTTVVVVNPGWGDAIQANKAGLIEVADIFVINKSDRPGSEEVERDLNWALDQTMWPVWRPPILRTVGPSGEGVEELVSVIADHRGTLEKSGELAERRSRRLTDELAEIVARRLELKALETVGESRFDELRTEMAARRLDPHTAADRILAVSLGSENG